MIIIHRDVLRNNSVGPNDFQFGVPAAKTLSIKLFNNSLTNTVVLIITILNF